jgi:chemotaxis protein methyltransferase CheR
MTPELFRKFSAIAYAKAGIALKEGKETLVAARIRKRQRILGIGQPEDYLKYLEEDKDGEELVFFLDAISTNFTSFFRENEHFIVLRRLLGKWFAQDQRRLRIWCAASSSGEEPYSIAIAVLESAAHCKIDFKLLATDISTDVLRKAKNGIYTEKQLETLSKRQKLLFFSRAKDGDSSERVFQVNPAIRERIVFKRLNLAKPPFPMSGPFDVVFCRNVMIYFDTPVRQKLVSEIYRLLKPGGIFFTAHSETLMGLASNFRALAPSIYCRSGDLEYFSDESLLLARKQKSASRV